MKKEKNDWLRPELVASWREIISVLIIVIGFSAARSVWSTFRGSSTKYIGLLLSDRSMIHYVAVEGAMLALLFAFLHWRGWTVADFKIKPDWWSSLQGILLCPVMMVGNSVTVACAFVVAFVCQTRFSHFLSFLSAQAQHLPPHSIHLSWASLIAAMIFNAFFEELTCMGYAFTQFAAKRGPLFALFLTVILRMSCHSYQGPVHMLGIGVVFLLAGLVYWRTRNLWPLVIAHALIDIFSSALVKILHG